MTQLAFSATGPLADGLAALGLARATGASLGWGEGGTVWMAGPRLDSPTLLARWLRDRWQPLPIVSPWSGGAGLGVGWAGGTAKASARNRGVPAAVLALDGERWRRLQGGIRAGQAIAATAVAEAWPKARMLAEARNRLPDDAVEWADTCYWLDDDGVPVWGRVAGTGGNVGSLDYSALYARCVALVAGGLDRDHHGVPLAFAWAYDALTGGRTEIDQMVGHRMAPAPELPAGALDWPGPHNPWRIALAIEGMTTYASSLAATTPWQFGPSPSGEVDASGEVWLPLSRRPATWPEVRQVVQAPVQWAGHRARSGTDMALSLAAGGVPGVDGAARWQLVTRNGRTDVALHGELSWLRPASAMSSAERSRAWRARQGARTGQRGPKPTQPCTYRRHKKAGEEPCPACRAAERERQQALYAARKARESNKLNPPA